MFKMSGTAGKVFKAIKSFFNKPTNTNMLQESIKVQESANKLNAVKLDPQSGKTSQEQIKIVENSQKLNAVKLDPQSGKINQEQSKIVESAQNFNALKFDSQSSKSNQEPVKEIDQSNSTLEEFKEPLKVVNVDKILVNDDTTCINEDKMNANEKNISYIKEVSTKEGKAELCDIKEEKVLEDLFPKTSNIKEEASHCIPPTKIDIPIVEDVILKQVLPSKDNSQLRTFKTIKPHIPLIKFRKGGLALQSIAANVGQVSEMPVDSLSNKTNPMATKVYSLEWWQTPSKFKRRTIDELECDAINSGGGDRLWQ